MSKNIVDGKLVETSPTMISAFDPSARFGCERKGFYKYVMGLPDPPTGNQELGTDLHWLVEQRLKTGKTPVAENEAAGLYLAGEAMIEEVASRKIISVESPIKTFTIADVKLKGYVDVVHETGIVDWKTSSDIRRYGKTAAELATDTQMVLYGKSEHPTLERVKLAHGYFQTRGRKSTELVEVEVTQEHLDSHISKVIVPLVERIKVVAGFEDARQATPDTSKCFNCAFRPRCPQPGAETVMSFFSKVLKKDESASAPSSVAVLPPDAPKSDPEKAAAPVEGFSPVPPPRKMKIEDVPEEKPELKSMTVTEFAKTAEPEKRKPGRPPGAKNKPKEMPEILKQKEMVGPNLKRFEESESNPAERQFESVTVSMGCTVNVGNFNSVRFDVAVTSKQHTYEEVYAEVKRRLDAEAEKYEAEIDKNNKTNAKGVVSK